MKKLVLAFLILLLGVSTAFTGGQTEPEAVEERPIWLWSLRTERIDPDWEAMGNEWAEEKFGASFYAEGYFPTAERVQALETLMAEGKMPDVITSIPYNTQGTKLLTDLAKSGQIIPLDKYFNDPENYPVFAEADQDYLRSYKFNGELYAVPGWNWRIRKDDPFIGKFPGWWMGADIYEKYGNPKTYSELTTLLKKVKADGLTQLDGKTPRIPFSMLVDSNMMWPKMVLNQGGGAGWEIDPEKRLMPVWASEEIYEQIKYFNMLWREGLMSPGTYIEGPGKFEENIAKHVYAVAAGHGGYTGATRDTLIFQLVPELGVDHPDVKAYQAKQPIMMIPPITDNPGRYTIRNTSFIMIAATNPNPDATLSLMNWLVSDEGVISCMYHNGLKGVDWEEAPAPRYWQIKGGFHGEELVGTQTSKVGGEGLYGALWEMGYTDPDTGEKIARFPWLWPMMRPALSSWVVRLGYEKMEKYRDYYGIPIAQKPGEPDGAEFGMYLNLALNEFASPIPSYDQMIADVPPLESAALATAEQRYNTGLVSCLTAETEAAFQTEYENLISSLIDVANWKPIYEAKNKRWVDWLEANKFDDRPELKSVTPIADWKKVMEW